MEIHITKNGVHVIYLPMTNELTYFAVYFPSGSKPANQAKIAHLTEHIVIDVLRESFSAVNNNEYYQYWGAYTQNDYTCYYTYDAGHIDNTVAAISSLLYMIQQQLFDLDFIAPYFEIELSQINKEVRSQEQKGVVASIESQLYPDNGGFEHEVPLYPQEVLNFIERYLRNPTILIVGKNSIPGIISLLEEKPSSELLGKIKAGKINHCTQVFDSKIVGLKLPFPSNLIEYITENALLFLLKTELEKNECCRIKQLSVSATNKGNKHCFAIWQIGVSENHSFSIKDELINYLTAPINKELYTYMFERVKYEILLSLNHADAFAMWAYKSSLYWGETVDSLQLNMLQPDFIECQKFTHNMRECLEVSNDGA